MSSSSSAPVNTEAPRTLAGADDDLKEEEVEEEEAKLEEVDLSRAEAVEDARGAMVMTGGDSSSSSSS